MNFIDKNTLSVFGHQANLLNTLNGGVSMTTVRTVEEKDSMIIYISAPSVSLESFNVFVDLSKLIIFSGLQAGQELTNLTHGEVAMLPLFYKTFDIPFFVDGDKIDAVYEDGELKVALPFKEAENKLKRKIVIKHS